MIQPVKPVQYVSERFKAIQAKIKNMYSSTKYNAMNAYDATVQRLKEFWLMNQEAIFVAVLLVAGISLALVLN